VATVAEVQVTGTHIRGPGSMASPVVTLNQDDLVKTGQATLAGALNQLPQNFGGQNTEGTLTTRADRGGLNGAVDTSINLRGLGSNATLVLVDGRRVSGAGNFGSFADLSTLPTLAVARVDVLLDGASAIYGSDAVGGVVNVILRKDVDGAEVRLRGGGATDGAPDEQGAGVLFGHTWANGGVLLSYEAYHRSALGAGDRRFTASADLRPFGGSDFRSTSAFPGNVIAVNPATGVSGPFFGIPAGQSGVGLTAGSFHVGAVNLTTPQADVDILPESLTQTLYVALHQALGDRLEFSADARSGYRRSQFDTFASTATLTVTRANPFFVSPNGATSNTIAYSFAGELPNPRTHASAENDALSFAAHLRLNHDWAADGYIGLAQDIEETHAKGAVNTLILAEALGNAADNPATAYTAARDGFFNPYTGIAANPSSVTKALASGFQQSRVKTQLETANLQADGPLFGLPGGQVRLAIGANVRHESFDTGGSSYSSSATPSALLHIAADRTVSALFAEVRAPLVSGDNPLPAVQALEVSAAVRYERYSDFGDTVDPKVGVVWQPAGDLKVRGTWGRSFRAPAFQELLAPLTFTPINFLSGVGTNRILSLAVQGGNPGLQPETAKSWTAGVDYAPHWAGGLRLSATWFDTRFTNRIDRPVLQNTLGALTDPRFAAFRQLISPGTNPADLTTISNLLNQPAGANIRGLNPLTAYGAIVQLQEVNTGSLIVRGLDLQVTDRFTLLGGMLDLSGNATRLYDYTQALTPTATSANLVGLATDPAKLKGRLGATWTQGEFSAGVAWNYLSGSRDSLGNRIDALTTIDAQVAWTASSGGLSGTTLTLGVRNLFNTDPPFYNNPFGFAFDPSSSDAIGRFLSVQISKRW
jgi:iron complex outermembrane receptor protein